MLILYIGEYPQLSYPSLVALSTVRFCKYLVLSIKIRASFLVQVLAFATVALAQTPGFDPFFCPLDQSKYKVGDVLPIAWNATETGGKISLTLVGGTSAKDLAPVTVIAGSSLPFPPLLPPLLVNNLTHPSAHIDNTPGAPTTYAWPIPPTIGTFASYGVNLTLGGAMCKEPMGLCLRFWEMGSFWCWRTVQARQLDVRL